MPLYNFSCPQCPRTFRKIMTPELKAQLAYVECPVCAGQAFHVMGAATSQTMEVLDNGLMPRRLERYSEAERIFRERAEKHTHDHRDVNDGPRDEEEA